MTPIDSFDMDIDNINSDDVPNKAIDIVSVGPAWFSKFGSKSMSDQHYPHDLEIELYRAQVEYFPESFPSEWTELHNDQQDMILYGYLPNDQIRGKFFAVLQDIPGASDATRETIVNDIHAVVQAMLKRLEVLWNKDDAVEGHSLTSMVQSGPIYHKSCSGQRAREDSKKDDHVQGQTAESPVARSNVFEDIGGRNHMTDDDNDQLYKELDEASDLTICIKAMQALCFRIVDVGEVDSTENNLRFATVIDRVNEMELYLRDQLKVLQEFRRDFFVIMKSRSCLQSPNPMKRARVVSEETKQLDELSRSPKKQARTHMAKEADYECDEGVAMGDDGNSPFRPRAFATIRH